MRFTFALLLFSTGLMAQNLKTFQTWYDPLTKTTIHEVYTTLPSAPYLKQGSYKEYDKYGNLSIEIAFSNGKKNGPSKTFYDAGTVSLFGYPKSALGKLYSITNYKNGELHGQEIMYSFSSGQHLKKWEKLWENGIETKHIKYYDDGTKQSEIALNGLCTAFYPTGKMESKYYAKGGLMNGRCTYWHPNGVVSIKGKCKDDNYIDTLQTFSDKGIPLTIVILDPVTSMLLYQKDFSIDGKIKKERKISANEVYKTSEYDTISGSVISSYSEINDGKGDVIKHGLFTFYKDGVKKSEVNYLNGERNGELKVFDKKNRITMSGKYERDLKSGSWKIFYDNDWNYVSDLDSAQYYRIIEFQNDKPIGKVHDYYINNVVQWEGQLLSIEPDVIDGYSIYYYPTGQKFAEGKFSKGEKTGEWKTYNTDGSILESKTY